MCSINIGKVILLHKGDFLYIKQPGEEKSSIIKNSYKPIWGYPQIIL